MRTNYLKLVLPDDGSSANWSAAVNNNFKKIEETIQDIRSNMVNEVKSIKFDSTITDYRVSGIIHLYKGTKNGSVEMVVNQTNISAQVALNISICKINGNDAKAEITPLFVGYEAMTEISKTDKDSTIKVTVTIDEDAALGEDELIIYVSAAYSLGEGV